MGFTVTGKLNKAAEVHEASNGGAVYKVSIGKKEYDRVAKESIWVNYSAGLYANDKQREYFNNVLVAGAVISVSASGLIPNIWQGNDGQKVYLNLNDSKLEFAATGYDSEANKQGVEQVRQAASGFETGNANQASSVPAQDDFQQDSDIPF